MFLQLNDRLSFGQHKVWKQMTVNWSGAKKGNKCLDLCCGSGDLAFLLAKAAGPSGQVACSDLSNPLCKYLEHLQTVQRHYGDTSC